MSTPVEAHWLRSEFASALGFSLLIISVSPLLQLLPMDTCRRQMSTVYRNLDMSGWIASQGHEVKVNPHILAAVAPDAHQSSCVLPLPALSAASRKKRAVTGYHVARRERQMRMNSSRRVWRKKKRLNWGNVIKMDCKKNVLLGRRKV